MNSQSPEALKEVMRRWLNGEPRQMFTDRWADCDPNDTCWSPTVEYRIKPSKNQRVPLTPADIPPVCWLRTHTDFSRAYLVGLVARLEVAITDYSRNERVSYDRLFENHWEYSSDRVNWRPCYKEVEQ